MTSITVTTAGIDIDGVPTLLLGGQLHNSSSSDPLVIADVCERVRRLGGNTVLAPVCWDLVEPVEGAFDFSLVDTLLGEADRQGLRLVPLWFGAFKNAGSTYAPRWVRNDVDRFPRAVVNGASRPAFTYEGATAKPVLSVFSTELRAADGAAFGRLIEHIVRHPLRHVVTMIQVENEVGLLADARDRSAIAESVWGSPVPDDVFAALRADGEGTELGRRGAAAVRGQTWAEALGTDDLAHEVFMACGFASYVESLAARGREQLGVPYYTNAWLGPQPGQDRPGQYPSGGPASTVIQLWRALAPSLTMVSPDIYVDDAAGALATYGRGGNRLFVPECRPRLGDAILALGAGAIGWSAFGIDEVRRDGQLAGLFNAIGPVAEEIALAQRDSRVAAVVLDGDGEVTVDLDGVRIVARGTRALFERMLLDAGVPHLPPVPASSAETEVGARITAPHDDRPCALIIARGDDVFDVIGQGLTVDFEIDGLTVEIDAAREVRSIDGAWRDGRSLNGDERLNLLPQDRVGITRISLLRLPTSID